MKLSTRRYLDRMSRRADATNALNWSGRLKVTTATPEPKLPILPNLECEADRRALNFITLQES